MPSAAAIKYDDLDMHDYEDGFGRAMLRKSDRLQKLGSASMLVWSPSAKGDSQTTRIRWHKAEHDEADFRQPSSWSHLDDKWPDDLEQHTAPSMFQDYIPRERGHILFGGRAAFRQSAIPDVDSLRRRIRERVYVDREAKVERYPLKKRRVVVGDINTYETILQAMSAALVNAEPTVESIIDDIRAGGQVDIADRLALLQQLVIEEPDNEPIAVSSLVNAAKILKYHSLDIRPSIVVGYDGRISVEWDEETFGFSLVMMFLTSGEIWYELGDDQHEDAYTITVAEALNIFAPLINPG